MALFLPREVTLQIRPNCFVRVGPGKIQMSPELAKHPYLKLPGVAQVVPDDDGIPARVINAGAAPSGTAAQVPEAGEATSSPITRTVPKLARKGD